MERQQLNVFRMRLLGAEVRPVDAGTATLKDATSEAIRDWVTNVETTHYILGSAAGPHPYPMMVGSMQHDHFLFQCLCVLFALEANRKCQVTRLLSVYSRIYVACF